MTVKQSNLSGSNTRKFDLIIFCNECCSKNILFKRIVRQRFARKKETRRFDFCSDGFFGEDSDAVNIRYAKWNGKEITPKSITEGLTPGINNTPIYLGLEEKWLALV